MADTLAIVARTIFESEQESATAKPGDGPLAWDDYESKHPFLDRYHEPGDRLFLVTVRPGPPEQLWLIAVYEDVYRDEDIWRAKDVNRTRIVDITSLRPELRFHTGKGLTQEAGKLGNSLQNPRMLTAHDIELLEGAIRKSRQRGPEGKTVPPEVEAEEGERIYFEVGRYTRSPELALACLERDGRQCCHCGFSVEENLAKVPKKISRILHAHHVHPLHLTKEATTKLKDLVTLCPTCHAVAHALARALGRKRVDLKLLKKHYPISTRVS